MNSPISPNQSLIFADILDKFAKRYAAKLMAMRFCHQTLAKLNFHHLR